MDPIILSIAFVLGLLASRVGLPPLVGFLVAGFALNALGFSSSTAISTVGDLGVTLLLFTIGLKLKVKQLLRPEIWAAGTLHMLFTVLLFGAGIQLLVYSGCHFFLGMSVASSLLLGFALSFSSTVFAVKILEEGGQANALNGRTAIGVLIIQDLLAVLFITFSTGKIPSPWALLVLALLPVARWVFGKILDNLGHGELQVLFGMALALAAGAGSFELVGLKADLGALIMGVLLATHPRAKGLAESLLSIKDFMLLGFFLNIGLGGLPTLGNLAVGLLLVLAIPVKSLLFFLLFTRFNLSSRTSFITAVNLTNYSEFGLIVGAIGVANGWIGSQWLVVLAIALSLSFLLASPLNVLVEELFEKWRFFLNRFETTKSHPDEERIVQTIQWHVVIVGMGRVGAQAYDVLRERLGKVVLGVDSNHEKVQQHVAAGRDVVYADVSDGDFWRRLAPVDSVKIGVFTVPSMDVKLYAMEMAKQAGAQSKIVAVAQYDDEVQTLLDGGADYAFNIYDEIGRGLAGDILKNLDGDA